jgi:hypothetical protein
MVQIKENWSDIEGEVSELLPNPADPSFAIAKVKVNASAPVGSFANLLEKDIGKEISVRVPNLSVEGLAPGHRILMRVRQAGIGQYFSHPNAPIERK